MPPIIIDPRRAQLDSEDNRRRRAAFSRRWSVYLAIVVAENAADTEAQPLTFDRDDITFDRSDITFDQTEE